MGAARVAQRSTDPRIMDAARKLRRESTDAERILWRALRGKALGVRFRRQYPVPPYVADFASVEARLVVEIDGGQHGDASDAMRDKAMRVEGWEVVRYWNNAVLQNLEGVLADIAERLRERMG